jgi:hypothetical protein
MSALTMVLMAAMAVPGDGPKKGPGEKVQGLELRGEWEGEWIVRQTTIPVSLRDGKFYLGHAAVWGSGRRGTADSRSQ